MRVGNIGKISILRKLFVLLLALTPLPAWAFNFAVANIDEVPIQMTIGAYNNCYKPDSNGSHRKVVTIQPNTEYKWTFRHQSGGGCDSTAGEFKLTFDPAPSSDSVERNAVAFWHDGRSAMGTLPTRIPNSYEGRFAGSGGNYIYYTSGRAKKFRAPSAKGEWRNVCSGHCNRETTRETKEEKEQSSSMSQEEKTAISVSLEAGVEFGPASASVSTEASSERTVGRTMSQSFMSGETNTDHSNYEYSPDDMTKYNIESVWQWVVPMTLSAQKKIVIRSNYYTCTSGRTAPTYSPISDEAVGTCRGKLAKKEEPVAPVVQQPAPVAEAPVAVAADTEVYSDEAGEIPDELVGYLLFYNGELVSGPDARYYTWEQAEANCLNDRERYPQVLVQCAYNGVEF